MTLMLSKKLEQKYSAPNYGPLNVTLTRGEGVYVWDEDGRRYLDMMGAYSAVSFGHCNPHLVSALIRQATRLDTTSRAYFTDRLGPFCQRACELTGLDKALPCSGGAEAVETALKAARKWGYYVKGIRPDPEIIVAENNFHGRTITITGFSSIEQYRDGFGPFTPGFVSVPFGDVAALERAITPRTAAFLVEPIQGEAGIVVPPLGYLAQVSAVCKANNVLLIADEIQTGLGRTGRLLACQHDMVIPDGLILGKALGGGLLPVSMFLGRDEVMNVFKPGDHGSTFGGNPLAAAVGLEALNILSEGEMIERSYTLGAYRRSRLRHMAIRNGLVCDVRGRGLFVGVELYPRIDAQKAVDCLLDEGVLTKHTHRNTIRLAPPFVIDEEQLDFAVDAIENVLDELK